MLGEDGEERRGRGGGTPTSSFNDFTFFLSFFLVVCRGSEERGGHFSDFFRSYLSPPSTFSFSWEVDPLSIFLPSRLAQHYHHIRYPGSSVFSFFLSRFLSSLLDFLCADCWRSMKILRSSSWWWSTAQVKRKRQQEEHWRPSLLSSFSSLSLFFHSRLLYRLDVWRSYTGSRLRRSRYTDRHRHISISITATYRYFSLREVVCSLCGVVWMIDLVHSWVYIGG